MSPKTLGKKYPQRFLIQSVSIKIKISHLRLFCCFLWDLAPNAHLSLSVELKKKKKFCPSYSSYSSYLLFANNASIFCDITNT